MRLFYRSSLVLFLALQTGCVVTQKLSYWEPSGVGTVRKLDGARQSISLHLSTNAALSLRVSDHPDRWPPRIDEGATNIYLSLHLNIQTNGAVQFTAPALIYTAASWSNDIPLSIWVESRIGGDGIGYLVDRDANELLNGRTAVVTKFHGVKPGSHGKYHCRVQLPRPLERHFSLKIPETIVDGLARPAVTVVFTNKIERVWYITGPQE